MPNNAKQQFLKDMNVRYNLQPGDMGKVIYLHAVIYAEEYDFDHTFEGYVASGLAEFTQTFNAVKDRLWIAEIEGEIIGFTSLIIKDQEAEIEPVIVSHKHRGKGIGERLVKYTIEEARKLKILCLSVKPVARNKEAISFFYDCGFRTIGHIQQFIWLGESEPNEWKDGLEILGKKFKY